MQIQLRKQARSCPQSLIVQLSYILLIFSWKNEHFNIIKLVFLSKWSNCCQDNLLSPRKLIWSNQFDLIKSMASATHDLPYWQNNDILWISNLTILYSRLYNSTKFYRQYWNNLPNQDLDNPLLETRSIFHLRQSINLLHWPDQWLPSFIDYVAYYLSDISPIFSQIIFDDAIVLLCYSPRSVMIKLIQLQVENPPTQYTTFNQKKPFRSRRLHLSIPKIQYINHSPERARWSVKNRTFDSPDFRNLKIKGVSSSQRIVSEVPARLSAANITLGQGQTLAHASSMNQNIFNRRSQREHNNSLIFIPRSKRMKTLPVLTTDEKAYTKYDYLMIKKQIQSLGLKTVKSKTKKQRIRPNGFLRMVGTGCKFESHLTKETIFLKESKSKGAS